MQFLLILFYFLTCKHAILRSKGSNTINTKLEDLSICGCGNKSCPVVTWRQLIGHSKTPQCIIKALKLSPFIQNTIFNSQNNRYSFLRSKDSFIFFSLRSFHFIFSQHNHPPLSLSLFFSHASFIFTHFLALSVPNFPENLFPPRTPLVLVSLDRPLGSDSLFISINALHLNLTELS